MASRRTFPLIAADPPWLFEQGTHKANPQKAGHYELMPIDAIIGLGPRVRAVATPRGSYLFMWAPNALLVDGTAQEVMRLWGWKPKQLCTWVKNRMGCAQRAFQRTSTPLLARTPRSPGRPTTS